MSVQPAGEGMRNPARALRGIASGLLILEVIVVLLAIPATSALSENGLSGLALAALLGLAAGLVLLCAVISRPWAGPVGTVLQVGVVASGFLAWPMFVLGLLFGSMWVAYLRLARTL